jgi:hypothetical protein
MRWKGAAVLPVTVLALTAGLLLSAASPASAAPASPASAAPAMSLRASKILETDTGPTRTAAMPGGGYLAVHSFGTLSRTGPDGRTLWQRSTASLYRDWGVQWQDPAD